MFKDKQTSRSHTTSQCLNLRYNFIFKPMIIRPNAIPHYKRVAFLYSMIPCPRILDTPQKNIVKNALWNIIKSWIGFVNILNRCKHYNISWIPKTVERGLFWTDRDNVLDLTFYPYEVTLFQNDIFVQKKGPFQEIWAWFVDIFREQTSSWVFNSL